jgi:hypothetical protein
VSFSWCFSWPCHSLGTNWQRKTIRARWLQVGGGRKVPFGADAPSRRSVHARSALTARLSVLIHG